MRYTDVLALAMGQMVAAQTNTFSTLRFGGGNGTATDTATGTIGTETTGTETTAAATTTGAAGGIGNPAGFNFLGCFSGNGFPGFALAYNSEDNDSDECAEACAGSNFFGLNDGSCYCGSELDLELTQSVSTDQCDIICPGDDSENCGGMITSSRIMRRQSVDINILLSIYVAIGVNPGATDTVINTDIITQTLDASTTTATVTFTESGVTATKTVIALLPVVPTDVIIVCYGNYCAPQVHCPTCTKWQVVCEDDLCAPRECHDDTWNKIKICKNGSCYYSDYKEHDLNQRIICHGSSCVRETSEEYARKLVCDVDEDRYYFDTCKDDCYTYEKCSNGECEPVHPPVDLPKPISPPKPVHSGKPPVVVVPEPKPEHPEAPSKPEHPTKPNMPEHPETPSKPVKSGVPAKPEHPEAPAKPEQPAAKPQQPEHPETPAKPEQPETPSKEEHPEAPAKEVPVVTAGAAKSFAGLAAAMAGFAFAL